MKRQNDRFFIIFLFVVVAFFFVAFQIHQLWLIDVSYLGEELRTENISDETRLVMQHLGNILKEADMDYRNLVKCSIFLSDMDLFAAVNEVYAGFFYQDPPARETVAVKTLPKGVNVEISGIAVRS